MQAKYEVIIYWSKDDGAYIAEAPELAGCAADGITYAQALANIEIVIAEWGRDRAITRTPGARAARPADVCLMFA